MRNGRFQGWNGPLFAAHDTAPGTRYSVRPARYPTILLAGGPRRDFPGSAGLFLGLAEREAEREGSLVATHAAPESR